MRINPLVLAATAIAALAATANAQISLSGHNFSSYGWAGNEICKPCHTPHFGNETVGRLWNHALTTATYQMHKGTGTAVLNLDNASRMCLSCHDGTVALDSFGGVDRPTSGAGSNMIPTGDNLGTNLADDHPVGSDAIYPTTTVTYMNPITITTSSSGTTSAAVTFGSNTLRLKNWVDSTGTTKYVVGCTTCHNAHNKGNFPHMTQITNNASTLCLVCHIK